MEHCFLYHCNAYTYGDPTWFPDMDPKVASYVQQGDQGFALRYGGKKAKEDWKVNGQYVDTPEKGIVGDSLLG